MQCSQIHKYKVAHTINKPDPITSQTKSFHILKKIIKRYYAHELISYKCAVFNQ